MGTGNSYLGGSPQQISNLNSVAFNKSPNLRGLGPQATLNLVNGHRMPFEGANMNTFDGDDIPVQFLRGVEIVADGTSPIYGADAIAGTVNYLFRQPENTIETYAGYGFADGTSNWYTTAVVGHDWGSGGIIVAYEHNHYDALQAKDRRSLYTDDYTPFSGPPSSDFSDPGNVIVGGVDYAIPGGQDGTALTLSHLGAAGTSNRQNVWVGVEVIPKSDRDSVVFNATQRITDWLDVFADGLWSERDYAVHLPSTALYSTLTVPNSNFYSPCNRSLAGADPALVTACGTGSLAVHYNMTQDINGQLRPGYFRTIGGSAGFHIHLPYDWEITARYSGGLHRESDVTTPNRGVNPAVLGPELAGTTAATAFNPFCDGNAFDCNPASLTDPLIAGTGFLTRIEYSLNEYSLSADGPVFHLPGGDIRLAVGGDLWRAVFTNVNNFGTTQESRHVKDAYAELYIPIFGADNAVPFARSLDLDIAGRIDDYSDVGETKNYKFGVDWRPIDDLKLHGSMGTSFRAPGLADNDPFSQHIWIVAGPYPGSSIDPGICPLCQSQPALAYFQGVGGANHDVGPETSRSWSLGADWTPKSVDGLDLGANWWKVTYTGQINTPVYNVGPYQAINQGFYDNYIIYNPTYFPAKAANNPVAFFGDFPTVNNANPNCAAVHGQHVTTQALFDQMVACIEQGGDAGLAGPPLPSSAIAALESGHRLNSGVTIGKGIDFTGNYSWDDTWGMGGRWRLGGVAEWILNWDVSPIATAPVQDEANHFGYPLRFKLRGQIGYDTPVWVGDLSTTVYVNYASSYRMDLNLLPAGVGPKYADIDSYTTADFSLIYRTDDTNGFLARGLTFSFSVQNVFDDLPPLVLNSGSLGGIRFDPSNGSPLGRVMMFQIGKSW